MHAFRIGERETHPSRFVRQCVASNPGSNRLYLERWAAMPCRFAQPLTQTLVHGKLPFHPNKRTINSEHIFKLYKTFAWRTGKRAPSRFEQTEHELNGTVFAEFEY